MNSTAEQAICELSNVLEWAKGNRGSRQGNPYTVPEIKEALKFLAKLDGVDYLDVNTEKLSRRG